MPSLMEEAAALGSVLSENQILTLWLTETGITDAALITALHYAGNRTMRNTQSYPSSFNRGDLRVGACYQIYAVRGRPENATQSWRCGDWLVWTGLWWCRVARESNTKLRSLVLQILLHRFTQGVLDRDVDILTP